MLDRRMAVTGLAALGLLVLAQGANAQKREFFELEDVREREVPAVSFGGAPA